MPFPKLVIVSALPVTCLADKFIITRKFVQGISEYQRLWPGSVSVVMPPTTEVTNNLDNVEYRADELPFDLTVTPLDDLRDAEVLKGAGIALLSLSYGQTRLADVCRRLGVPSVYITENSLQTRLQIARSEASDPLQLGRRALWEFRQETRNRRAVGRATAIQCNGVPTFEAYRGINPQALLFFDTRVSARMLATDDALRRRFTARRNRRPLHLAFSGRLVAIKGADHLVRVAAELRNTGRDFTMSICGSGDLEAQIIRDIERNGLTEIVRLKGYLEFERELMPFMRDEVDLFVCCHRQGDPSCTYLETMSCGVPIIAYDNEAWTGLLRVSGAGWSSPLDRPKQMARRIAALTEDELDDHSLASLKFAQSHTFETEFQRRISHLQDIIGSWRRAT